MEFLRRIFRPRQATDEERARQGARLDAKRRHLRGKLARNQSELRGKWTAYRTWRGEAPGKKKVRAEIKHLEAERKDIVKQMLRLQSEMKSLGYEAAAGHVDMH